MTLRRRGGGEVLGEGVGVESCQLGRIRKGREKDGILGRRNCVNRYTLYSHL